MEMKFRTTNLENKKWGHKYKVQDEAELMGLVMELGEAFEVAKNRRDNFRA